MPTGFSFVVGAGKKQAEINADVLEMRLVMLVPIQRGEVPQLEKYHTMATQPAASAVSRAPEVSCSGILLNCSTALPGLCSKSWRVPLSCPAPSTSKYLVKHDS